MNKVSDVMSRDLIEINCSLTVSEAAQMMKEKRVGSLLINCVEDNSFGIFTERDFLMKIDYDNPQKIVELKVHDVMSRNLIMVDVDKPYEHVMGLMQDHNIRHMPVTREGKIVGMVSLRDLMNYYGKHLEMLLKQKEGQLLGNIQRVRDSEERMRSIFNSSADAIVFADKDGKIVAWNPSFSELTGLMPEDLFHKEAHSFFPPEEWDKINPDEIRRLGGRLRIETKLYNNAGALVDIEFSASILADENAEIKGYIGIMRDIRRRKENDKLLQESKEKVEMANKDLEANANILKQIAADKEKSYNELKTYQGQIIQMQKMANLGTLAAGFAHEVKNPLAIILQTMERVESIIKKHNVDSGMRYVDIIVNAATHANKVVTALLKYSRSSQLEVQEINIFDIIDGAIELIGHKLIEKNVEILRKYQREDRKMMGDGVMLQQIFFDLLNNAVDASQVDGKIFVSVDLLSEEGVDSESYRIKVKDNGHGIPKEYLSRVFDPFFTTKDEGKGTGLGLSTVYMIIERHSGSISVDSVVGQGAEFTINLPLKGATEIKRRFKHV